MVQSPRSARSLREKTGARHRAGLARLGAPQPGPHAPSSKNASGLSRADVGIAATWVLLAIVVRLPGILRPLVGAFATKSTVYAMIARNFARGEAPWWRPTVDVLVGGQPGWHLLEVPLSAYATGALWRMFGGALDVWGRATAIACSAAAVAWLYAAVQRTESRAAASMAALVMALAPVSVIYGQSFMLEPSAALLSIAAVDSFARWSSGGSRRWLCLGAAALAAAVLTKVYLALLVVSIMASGWQSGSRRRRALLAAICVACLVPALLWCEYVWQWSALDGPHAATIYYSLRDSGQAHRWPSPVLAELGFYAGVARDLATVVLTPLGAVLAVGGMMALRSPDRRRQLAPFVAWLGVAAALVVLLPAKFAAMNYYWLIVLPPLAVLVGVGWEAFVERWRPPILLRAGAVSLLLIGGLAWAAKPAFVTPPEDRAVAAAGAAVQAVAPPGQPVIASHGSCPDLLYYCDRRGWTIPLDAPNFDERMAAALREGARVFVWAGEPEDAAQVAARLDGLPELSATTLASGNGYLMVRLDP